MELIERNKKSRGLCPFKGIILLLLEKKEIFFLEISPTFLCFSFYLTYWKRLYLIQWSYQFIVLYKVFPKQTNLYHMKE